MPVTVTHKDMHFHSLSHSTRRNPVPNAHSHDAYTDPVMTHGVFARLTE